jgi:hypothetical protein
MGVAAVQNILIKTKADMPGATRATLRFATGS